MSTTSSQSPDGGVEGIRKETLASDPFTQFQRWVDDVDELNLPEPRAVTLATADASGAPSARVVLLKGFDGSGFVFFTNYESSKGHDLLENPRAELCFHWQELRRQVRVHGEVQRTSGTVSDDYFRSRPRGSQLGAWASPQSEPVENRAELEQRFAKVEQEYDGEDIPRPAHWGGYLLIPSSVEFWSHREDRLHDRLCYLRQGGVDDWTIVRYGP